MKFLSKFNLADILRFFTGAVFIFSAFSKLFPIELFELTIVNQGITNWNNVPFLSRFIIGAELAIGLSFFQKNFIRKAVVPAALLMLIGFTVHLTLMVAGKAEAGNCGCFGEVLPMSSIQAIWKNILLIIILIYLLFAYKEEKSSIKIPALLTFISYVFIIIFFPIKAYKVPGIESKNNQIITDTSYAKKEKPDSVIKKSSFDTLKKTIDNKKTKDSIKITEKISSPHKVNSIFTQFTDFSTGSTDLNEGLKLVALFSLTCEDCMSKAKEITELEKNFSPIPLYIIFWGEPSELSNFFGYSGKIYPYKITDAQTFFPLIKNAPPRIVLLYNGNILSDWDEKTFKISELETQLKKYSNKQKEIL